MAALTPVTETVATVEESERVTDQGKMCFNYVLRKENLF